METEKWGRTKAEERYGPIRSPAMKPADQSQPQFREDQPLDNDMPEGSWLRGGNEDATQSRALTSDDDTI